MKELSSEKVVVYTSSELKSVLEGTNSYNYVYLGSDIKLESGISINKSKSSVTIDGTYENVRHTMEDVKTLNSGDTISVADATTLYVKVCNLDFVGNNYYGVIFVREEAKFANTTIEYNNILYNGVQLSFNPYGVTRIVSSVININDGSLVVGNEVAECNKIELGGNTKILHNSKSNSLFWFRNTTPALTILADSEVSITSTYREVFYGTTALIFNVLENAKLDIITNSGFAYNSYGTSTTNIGKNASVSIKKTGTNGGYATWYSNGVITVSEGASLKIINDFTGISTSNYNITFSSSGGFYLNNPKEVVLYNSKANIINVSGTIPFDFTMSRVNLFDSAITLSENISKSTLPTYSWYKSSEPVKFSGTFTSSRTTITSNNLTTEEQATLPLISNFVFPNKRIFSIGRPILSIGAITDEDTVVKGLTLPNASVLIRYLLEEYVVVADSSGYFSLNIANTLEIGTEVTFDVKKENDAIYNTRAVTVVYSGELFIQSAPNKIEFLLEPITIVPIICPKKESINIEVVDSRVNSTNWKLYAYILKGLTSENNFVLEKSLVFKSENEYVTLSENPVLVYSGESNGGELKKTEVVFEKDIGVLLRINDKVMNNKTYTTNIIWKLEE